MKTDNVNHPSHYADQCSIECFDALKAVLGYEGTVYFCFGNMFKYLWRHKFKNGKEDVEKATWYSIRAMECIINIAITDEHTANRLSGIGSLLMDILNKADKEYASEEDYKNLYKILLNSIYGAKNMKVTNEPEDRKDDDKKYDLKDIVKAVNSNYGIDPEKYEECIDPYIKKYVEEKEKENPASNFHISEESLKKWEELMNEMFVVINKKNEDKKNKNVSTKVQNNPYSDPEDNIPYWDPKTSYNTDEKKEDKDLDDGLDEMLERLAAATDILNDCDKEEKNDAKDESHSKAEEVLSTIYNILCDRVKSGGDVITLRHEIKNILCEYYSAADDPLHDIYTVVNDSNRNSCEVIYTISSICNKYYEKRSGSDS